jgi:hypothetical protein
LKLFVTLFLGAILIDSALAQGSAGLPELEPLERFIGSWSYEGEDRTPGGGPVLCTSVRRWTAGGFFVESQRTCSTPRGELRQLEVYGFDYADRVYRYWGFNGQFVSTYAASTIDDGPILWDSVAYPGRYRCSETFEADLTSSTSQCEVSNGGAWSIISQGRSKRTSP